MPSSPGSSAHSASPLAFTWGSSLAATRSAATATSVDLVSSGGRRVQRTDPPTHAPRTAKPQQHSRTWILMPPFASEHDRTAGES